MRPTITRLECWVLRAPIAEPLANAFGAMSNRPALWLRVSASDGAYGWGEVFSNFPTVGAEHRARLVESLFVPLLLQTPADSAANTRSMLEARTRRMAIQCGEPGPFAQIIGGIDQALWDMSARRAGQPLWKHLGGTNPKVRVYASGLGPDAVGTTALAKQAQGFRAFKLKVGFSRERDRANTAELRDALGAAATLMVDANQAWTPEQAPAEIGRWHPSSCTGSRSRSPPMRPCRPGSSLPSAPAQPLPPARTCAGWRRSTRRSTPATCASSSPMSANGAASAAAATSDGAPRPRASRSAHTGSPAGSGSRPRCIFLPRSAAKATPRSTPIPTPCARKCSRRAWTKA